MPACLRTNHRPVFPDKTGSTVILKNVRRRDAGLYICTAENQVSQPVEKVTKISVQCKVLLSLLNDCLLNSCVT